MDDSFEFARGAFELDADRRLLNAIVDEKVGLFWWLNFIMLVLTLGSILIVF
jgi:hypothetical protein